jgi:hypothetical protein
MNLTTKKVNVGAGTMVVLLATIVLLVIFMPLAVIWAMNTLFSLGIAYGFYEWLAVFVLALFLNARNGIIKND